jgi:hypothetical protein
MFTSKIWQKKFFQQHIFTKLLYFYINSNGDKLDTEIVYLDEIDNFVVLTMSIWIHFGAEMIDTMFKFKIQKF